MKAVTCTPFVIADREEVIRIETIEAGTRIVLLAGKPLNEPIANMGPFVLTT